MVHSHRFAKSTGANVLNFLLISQLLCIFSNRAFVRIQLVVGEQVDPFCSTHLPHDLVPSAKTSGVVSLLAIMVIAIPQRKFVYFLQYKFLHNEVCWPRLLPPPSGSSYICLDGRVWHSMHLFLPSDSSPPASSSSPYGTLPSRLQLLTLIYGLCKAVLKMEYFSL